MSFKSKLINSTPANHMVFNDVRGTLHHNQYLSNITARVVQGFTLKDRQGDSIHIEALKLNMQLYTETGAAFYSYRIMVFFSGDEWTDSFQAYSAGVTASGTPFGDAIFPGQNAYVGSMITNPRVITKKLDVVIDLNSQIDTVQTGKTLTFTIPIDKEFKYQTNGTFGKFKNLYLLIIPSITSGTSNLTPAGDYAFNADLIYKNL